MTPDAVAALFTRSDGSYLFARWGRPIVPVVFGVDDATLAVVKGAVQAVVALAGHTVEEVDAELGANLMIFFCKDWDELRGVPNLERLVPGLDALCDRLNAADANQYRIFRFDRLGAIKAARIISASLSIANSRLRACDRVSSARITIAPSFVHRRPASRFSLVFTGPLSCGERSASNRSSTAVSTLLTFCPPGPEEREKFSVSSQSSMVIWSLIRSIWSPNS